MTEYSKAVAACIAGWGKSAAECNGNMECLERSARQLRECLDAAFPDSKRVEPESDKVNYMLSSAFFLANRLSKASQGLAEFDKLIDSIKKVDKVDREDSQLNVKFHKQLDEILAKYF